MNAEPVSIDDAAERRTPLLEGVEGTERFPEDRIRIPEGLGNCFRFRHRDFAVIPASFRWKRTGLRVALGGRPKGLDTAYPP
jgi:hypothetical protein